MIKSNSLFAPLRPFALAVKTVFSPVICTSPQLWGSCTTIVGKAHHNCGEAAPQLWGTNGKAAKNDFLPRSNNFLPRAYNFYASFDLGVKCLEGTTERSDDNRGRSPRIGKARTMCLEGTTPQDRHFIHRHRHTAFQAHRPRITFPRTSSPVIVASLRTACQAVNTFIVIISNSTDKQNII